jgi:D-3-phosphoglycerate dehydrogenase / 2-oxoglutarate reductase
MPRKILITDKVHDVLITRLKESGCEVTYDTSVDNKALEEIIHLYDGIIINSKIIMNKSRIDKCINLKFIGRLGSGLEIIDVDHAESKGIKVYNSPEGNRNAVAEHEMGMLLALLNNIVHADSEVRRFSWNREKNRGTEIRGKTIGIIGLGHTGCAFAEKLFNWGVRVISYDKYKTQFPSSVTYVEKTDLQTVMADSDIISLHLPLTDETYKLINDSFLRQCKHGVIISNTSRGQIVDTKALIDHLRSGHVGGACLDVFENEKPETFSDTEKELFSNLYELQNVVLTPHIAGWTHESLELIASVLFEKIKNGNHI